MKWGVVVFPGSNCDHDAYDSLSRILGQEVRYIWHAENDLSGLDAVVLPGGFSYGDYLRSGAIARVSPVMEAVIRFAEEGRTVIGICNGFQVLTEAGLVPGSLLRNQYLRFICEDMFLRVEHDQSQFTCNMHPGDLLEIPIAHNEGNYWVSEDEISEMEAYGQIVFRYADRSGNVSEIANPNGALRGIAGITNRKGNVLGMMPHPERRCDALLGGTDGRKVFESVISWAVNR